MREDLPSSLPLICIACRAASPHVLTLGNVIRRDGPEIIEGILGCERCGRRYAIIDRIPLLVRDTTAWLARNSLALVEPTLSPDVAAVLVEPAPDDAPIARLYELLSVYLDAHWGDHASPSVPHAAAIYDRLAARSEQRVAAAIELGCCFGRGVFELARGAELAVGVDSSMEALRRARVLLDGRELPHARRMSGRHYVPAPIRGARAETQVELICADALDLPLLPGRFGRVVAINMLDVVADPPALLATLVDLCEPGGELMSSSSYAWLSGLVHERRRIGTLDPGADIVRMLTWERGLALEEQADIDYVLRRDARNASSARLHWLRFRRPLT